MALAHWCCRWDQVGDGDDVNAGDVDHADCDDNDSDAVLAEAGQQQPLHRQLAKVASRPLVQRQVQGGKLGNDLFPGLCLEG